MSLIRDIITAGPATLLAVTTITLVLVSTFFRLISEYFFTPLHKVPGPFSHAFTNLPLALSDFQGNSTRRIHGLHNKYGHVVRISPKQLSFNSLAAVKEIYGAGSSSQRTEFYKIFEPYGVPTMFTLASSQEHAERKKLLAKVYAKSAILHGAVAELIHERVEWFLDNIEKLKLKTINGKSAPVEIGAQLHYFTLDVSSAFIYGPELGTRALQDPRDRALLSDFEHPLRMKLSWAVVTGVPDFLIDLLLKAWTYLTGQSRKWPTPFSLLRRYGKRALRPSGRRSQDQLVESKQPLSEQQPETTTLLSQLQSQRSSSAALTELDIASECVDHLLAGVETTRNTLLFLIWTLSLPEHSEYQTRLQTELKALVKARGDSSLALPTVAQCDSSSMSAPFLNAVVREALRLYAPLPALQPRVFERNMIIDGTKVPAGTTVSCSPYSMHRQADVFPDAGLFRPERWLDGPDHQGSQEAMKWYWPFSSGARMCTGSHLAMAEMTTLIAAVYSRYRTEVAPDFVGVSPAIISRFEIFRDERFKKFDERRCPIVFHSN